MEIGIPIHFSEISRVIKAPPETDPQNQQFYEATTKDSIRDAYGTIAQTLLRTEAAVFTVGVPWLPPTKAIRQRCSEYYGPLDDFIRQSLVSVNSKALEMYCEELEITSHQGGTVAFDDVTREGEICLELKTLPMLLRLPFVAMSVLAAFILGISLFSMLGWGMELSVFIGVFLATVAVFAAMICSSEQYRRESFYCLLQGELDRRQGLDDSQKNGLRRLVSIEPNA